MKLKLSNSYIKGYHIYHIRPRADISMEVERDFDNEYDEFAMKVSMPDATKVKAGLLDAITRPEKKWYRVCGIPRLAGFPDCWSNLKF